MFPTTHGFHPQQHAQHRSDNTDEFILEYESELAELTFNSKPIINNLTILAGENKHAAQAIVNVIEKRILSVDVDKKLPSLYLLDSICKNIKGIYIQLFSNNIVNIFSHAYQNFNQQLRTSLLHLLKTWHGLFPADKLQQIDALIQSTPSAATPASKSASIHVNPKFVQPAPRIPSTKPPPSKTPLPPHITAQLQEATKPAVEVPAPAATVSPPVAPPQPVVVPVPVPVVQPAYPVPGMDIITQLQLIVQQRTNQIMNDMKNPNLTQIEQIQIYDQLQKLYSISQLLNVQLLQPQNQLTLASVVQHLMSMASQSQAAPADLSSLMVALQSQPASTQPVLSTGLVNNYPVPSFPLATTTPSPAIANPFTLQTTPIPSGSSVGSQATIPAFSGIPANLNDPWSLDNLKRRDEGAVNGLYFAFPLQCKNCGLRFLDRERMDKHLDWHFNQNKRDKDRVKKANSRSWFLEREEWITDIPYNELDKANVPSPFAETDVKPKQEEIKQQISQVPADESQKNCPICGELFEQVYNEDQDEWMFRDAVISPSDNKIYHVHCHHVLAGETPNNGSESSSEAESSDSSDDEHEERKPPQHGQPGVPLSDMPPLEDIPVGGKRVQPEEASTVASDTILDQTKRPRVVE